MVASPTINAEFTVATNGTPLQGMLGIEDFVANVRPESFRNNLLRYQAAGDVPLYALTALMRSEQINDAKFHWFTKAMSDQQATITGIYTDASRLTPYVSGGVAGSFLYISMSLTDSKKFRPAHQVMLAYSADASLCCTAKVISVVAVSATVGVISVRLLEADDNSLTLPVPATLADADICVVIGNLNPDASYRPEAIAYTEVEYANYAQTFRTSVALSRRRRKLTARTGDPYKEAKADAFGDHAQEIEKAFLFGASSYLHGADTDNGQPETATHGLINFIRSYAPTNYKIFNLDTDSEFAGKKWTEVGYDWLLYRMEELFRYTGGGDSRLVLCGSLALLGLQKCVSSHPNAEIQVANVSYFGFNVRRFTSPFGNLDFKIHPLFSHLTFASRAMLVLSPQNLVYKYIDDTRFNEQKNKDVGENGLDGLEEDWLTDAGLELHFPHTFGFYDGIGLDNTATAD